MRTAISREINERIGTKIKPRIKSDNATYIWEEIKKIMMNTATTKLRYQTRSQKCNWMTNEILSLMKNVENVNAKLIEVNTKIFES